jgi:molybdenum cofactor biosynthesis enzyme MoaA
MYSTRENMLFKIESVKITFDEPLLVEFLVDVVLKDVVVIGTGVSELHK